MWHPRLTLWYRRCQSDGSHLCVRARLFARPRRLFARPRRLFARPRRLFARPRRLFARPRPP